MRALLVPPQIAVDADIRQAEADPLIHRDAHLGGEQDRIRVAIASPRSVIYRNYLIACATKLATNPSQYATV